ncbi:MAG: proton-conducting transporter membrane subunit, partial [Steroidobacteraceae bacterium]
MTLGWIIFIPLIGALLAAPADRLHRDAPRWIALAALAAQLGLLLVIWIHGRGGGPWLAGVDTRWIPQLGIDFRLRLDDLSLILLLLTIGLGAVSVVISWREIEERTGAFHANLLFTLAGVAGVFLALDLFLFFFFWELMLVPMYFLIAVWGHEHRLYASFKFFLFTQGSGLLMLVAILALAIIHWRETGTLTFDYFALLHTRLDRPTALAIMLGFFIAFAVKL